jgi:hypothetical protein
MAPPLVLAIVVGLAAGAIVAIIAAPLLRRLLVFMMPVAPPKRCPHGFADWDQCPDCCR